MRADQASQAPVAGDAPPSGLSRGFGTRLAGDAAVYGLGGVAAQAVAVLLVPIYARQIGEAGVGVTGVLNSAISFALMVAALALPQAFFRWYLREATTDQSRRNVLGTTLTIRIAASLLSFALVLAGSVFVSRLLYDGAYWEVFALAAPIVLFDSFNTIPLSVLRAERRARAYVVISLVRAILGTVFILALVVLLQLGVAGVALGSAIAALGAMILGLGSLRASGLLRLSLDLGLARRMLAFSIPLVPASIAGWTLNLSDRPLLQILTGDEATVGVYTLGYTAGLVINALVVQPFALAWGAAYWEISRADDAPKVFARVLTWFASVAAGVALALSAAGTDILRLLIGSGFELSRFIVPFSAFAYVLYGIHAILASGLNLADRTPLVAKTMGVAAVGSVVLNLALIPWLGIFGAAISTTASYAVLAVSVGIVSQRHYPVPWEVRRVISVLLIAAGLSAAALLGPDAFAWRLGCIAAYVPLLLGLRLVRVEQVRTLFALVRRR